MWHTNKWILMCCANKRNMRKHKRRMKQITKYMIVKKKSANRDKIETMSMPHVLLHPVEKNVFIPDDVIPEILVKLTARSVGRFRCVCKSWLSITTNLSFIRAHTQHNYFRHQSLFVQYISTREEEHYVASADSNIDAGITLRRLHEMIYRRVIASCDGLLYLFAFYDVYVINPLTGYSICLPFEQGEFMGFYFHRSTSKYRILQRMHGNVDVSIGLVIGEQSWRRLPYRFPCQLPHSDFHKAVDLNGCLFWLAFKEQSHFKQPDTIMTFDTESEVYSLLSLPPSELLLNIVGNLVDFNGELGLWVVDNDVIDVWIREECWVKRYSINYFDLIGCSVRFGPPKDIWIGGAAVFVKDKELLIDVWEARFLIRWDLKSRACYCYQREICDGNYHRFLDMGMTHSFPYMETLVYPDCPLTES